MMEMEWKNIKKLIQIRKQQMFIQHILSIHSVNGVMYMRYLALPCFAMGLPSQAMPCHDSIELIYELLMLFVCTTL